MGERHGRQILKILVRIQSMKPLRYFMKDSTKNKIDEEALKQFPVKLRGCGDGRDENFVKRECFKAGAYWAFKQNKEVK